MITDLLGVQAGRCGICGDPFSGSSFVVDHDHYNGMIRGLLCRGCNNLEGRHSRRRCDVQRGFCLVCMWRETPAVAWLGRTERYESGFPADEREARYCHMPWDPTIERAAAAQAAWDRNVGLVEGLYSYVTDEVVS